MAILLGMAAGWRLQSTRRHLASVGESVRSQGRRAECLCARRPNRTGIPWRYLPHDFSPWATTYGHFAKWQYDGLFGQFAGLRTGLPDHQNHRRRTCTSRIRARAPGSRSSAASDTSAATLSACCRPCWIPRSACPCSPASPPPTRTSRRHGWTRAAAPPPSTMDPASVSMSTPPNARPLPAGSRSFRDGGPSNTASAGSCTTDVSPATTNATGPLRSHDPPHDDRPDGLRTHRRSHPEPARNPTRDHTPNHRTERSVSPRAGALTPSLPDRCEHQARAIDTSPRHPQAGRDPRYRTSRTSLNSAAGTRPGTTHQSPDQTLSRSRRPAITSKVSAVRAPGAVDANTSTLIPVNPASAKAVIQTDLFLGPPARRPGCRAGRRRWSVPFPTAGRPGCGRAGRPGWGPG